MPAILHQHALDVLFCQARTHSFWTGETVSDDTLRQLYELMKWAPTSANSNPVRLVFVRTAAARQRLLPALDASNVAKVMAAPVTAIIASDFSFHEHLPELMPHNPGARDWFADDLGLRQATAFRNSSLQGGYFILAARALGLDCGPLSGFDNALVDREFFTAPVTGGGPLGNHAVRSNFLCNLGHGDPARLFPRGPRLPFDTACALL